MKRRSLLQGAGVFLAAWGANSLSLSKTAQVLAQPTPRKLALLVGINQYRNNSLNGCVTDLELQKELLIYQFGFQPSDILMLTDQQATRSQIETAFTEHLIAQAKPDDVVVFHFSGYGSLQKLGTTSDAVQPILITADEPIENSLAHVLSQDTLFLLLRSLATDQVTTVLDVGYSYPGRSLQGNLRLRSRPSDPATQLVADEIAFQESLLQKLSLDRSQVRVQWRAGKMPGVMLTATNAQQFAAETRWNGFSAGLFTYALTQQLWQAAPDTTLRTSLQHVSEQIGRRINAEQQPTLTGKKGHDRPLKPYLLAPTQPSEGVIQGVEDSGTARLWLGGVLPQVLEFQTNSLLRVDDGPVLQLVDRAGLTAKARFSADATPALKVGMRVQEAIRVLPKNVALSVAIDANLNRIERVDAISALSGLPRVVASIAGEQTVDYLFSKVQEATQVAALTNDAIKNTIAPAGYGLFSPGREPIPSTTGEAGEAVKVAVRRLTPQLQTLLGAKLLSLTVNPNSSQLGVRATFTVIDSDRSTQQSTDRRSESSSAASATSIVSVPVGSRIHFSVENSDTEPIYLAILGLDHRGSGFIFNVIQSVSSQPATAEWKILETPGIIEAYLICSRAPFQQTQTFLDSTVVYPVRSLPNFFDAAQAVLQDLTQARGDRAIVAPDSFALDVKTWATFRFTYQIT